MQAWLLFPFSLLSNTKRISQLHFRATEQNTRRLQQIFLLLVDHKLSARTNPVLVFLAFETYPFTVYGIVCD